MLVEAALMEKQQSRNECDGEQQTTRTDLGGCEERGGMGTR